MQEKARQCKDMQELNSLLAENDVELSEDALQAVAGGCSATSPKYNKGDEMSFKCPDCGCKLRYWDSCAFDKAIAIYRMYCNNSSCKSYNNGLWWVNQSGGTPEKY